MYFEIDDYNALREALHQMCVGFTAESVPEDKVFDSKLVASELLSNVLQHGGGRAYFRVSLIGNAIEISVKGSNGFRPPEKSACSGVTEECGRGLFLVDAVCETRRYSEQDGICVVIRI